VRGAQDAVAERCLVIDELRWLEWTAMESWYADIKKCRETKKDTTHPSSRPPLQTKLFEIYQENTLQLENVV
jgi:hypothetical protein